MNSIIDQQRDNEDFNIGRKQYIKNLIKREGTYIDYYIQRGEIKLSEYIEATLEIDLYYYSHSYGIKKLIKNK
jgi:hypothetical protein